jgi:hypothetical protein
VDLRSSASSWSCWLRSELEERREAASSSSSLAAARASSRSWAAVAVVAAPEVEESETMGAAAEVRVPGVERRPRRTGGRRGSRGGAAHRWPARKQRRRGVWALDAGHEQSAWAPRGRKQRKGPGL